ncbi:DNA helicase RecQ [Cesiribacter andamanensis]|uniref:DNA helicase RecQ n=1 Tax=Cesiribacter andamanensis AMV16 TaxID=1279009 RepID=M7P128_9BACT|nr:DNA helicase RecQ [Cesiribacter andamanensis]EMR04279.1 ATP-dependent DNA helicase recQ [Cesiribacter andamanensis AMV16]
MLVENKDVLRERLKEIFGYDQFRGNQEAIMQNVLEGRNTFVIMPTGAGKSLCYQLPALVQQGTAIVISPLIALMKNQVDQLNAHGVQAHFLNSTLSKTEINRVKKETLAGKTKLLYVAPESLTKDENIEFLTKADISFVAIDEAHCISEWGHDFRPEYRRIRSIISRLGNLPVIALTATATPKVQQDIQKNLQMEDADLFKSSFNRKNLYYEVRPKKHTKKQLVRFASQHKGKSGIVYCLSRKKVEEIAELLRVNGFKAAPYHAGLDPQVRMQNQDAFLNEEVDIIVATIAFGMGIDKPDVRFVVHYDTPKSLEGYYQETGRGGRDGLEGHCLMFYSYNDILKLEKFNKDKPVTERDNSKVLLQEMASYAESSVCRRRQLLHYFGESYEKDCGFCDNCLNPREKYEAREVLSTVLQAVDQTDQRFGLQHLAELIHGTENQYILSYSHNQLPVWATGSDEPLDYWKSAIRQALLYEFLEKDIENIGVLKLTPKGDAFLIAPHSLSFTLDHDYSTDEVEEENEKEMPVVQRSYDEALFALLKDLRKKLAKQKGLPPYVLFQDPSLEEMATVYPTSTEALAQIQGVGMGKVSKFGKPFIEAIRKFVEDNDIVPATDVVVKSAGTRSKTKIFVIQQIDRKIALEEIAGSLNMSMDELLSEIEHICYSGTKLNLDYYLEDYMDEERQDEIYDYFMSAETDSLRAALEELGPEDFSEDELRLMRVKFLSEHAL